MKDKRIWAETHIPHSLHNSVLEIIIKDKTA